MVVLMMWIWMFLCLWLCCVLWLVCVEVLICVFECDEEEDELICVWVVECVCVVFEWCVGVKDVRYVFVFDDVFDEDVS